jgi:hypothetical protein
MFIKTVSLNKKTAVCGIIAVAVVITAIILLVANLGSAEKHSIFNTGVGVKDNEARVAYLLECGWEVEEEPVDTKKVLIPKEFSDIITEYNRLQLSSGFDLTDYAGLTVEQYTYRVTNYADYDGDVLASLYIYNNQVIAGDIHSTSIDGFMHGLK